LEERFSPEPWSVVVFKIGEDQECGTNVGMVSEEFINPSPLLYARADNSEPRPYDG
jgi:hypothetical protein